MTPRGLRISCASPAESCPSAAGRSALRASASAPRNLAIGFLQFLGEDLQARDLAPIFRGELIDENSGDKKEEHADRQDR